MVDIPVQLVVAAFKQEGGANEALKRLQAAKRERMIGILDAAIIRRDEHNRLHIHETEDVGGGRGAAAGGVVGAIVGLIAGPPGVVVGGAVGALVGAAAARVIDAGIDDERLKQIGSALKPGTSAVVAIVEQTGVAEVEAMMADAGADVMTEAIKNDLARQLETDPKVADRALNLGEAVADGGMIATESQE